MESSSTRNDDQAAAARDLQSVENARREVVSDVVCPPGHELIAASSAGVNVAGVGMLMNDSKPLQVVGLVLVAFVAVNRRWMRLYRAENGLDG